ncbi:S8/S53 family peptidase [Aestuariivirga sp.]|uniref:S8/S53 family peptidase n=1 Tax=Aestuariivirga sp. TaxID=2650926 RepID=UPI003593C1C0
MTDRLRAVSQVMCAGDMDVAPERGATLLGERRFQEKRTENWLRDWRLTDGGMIRVTRGERVGAPVLYFVAYYAGKNGRRPMMRLVWDDRCALRGGERIVYDKNGLGAAIRLELLDPELHLRAAPIPLNPPVPEGTPRADCTRVGLLDNGVNYLLPQIAARLARDPNGALVGRDFWEADDRPFDFGVPDGDPDPRLSAFDPPQHGTGLASVLIADTPAQICLAIYRYSPPDIRNEIEGIVDRMAADGVRVVVMASGRDRAWPAFRSAMLAHPELLFIAAAGNDGADLRQRALYPMVYAVPNQLVVTAVTAEGAVWPPGNTGAGIVALALPAVGVPGLAFDGRRVGLTGTSYAAPRAGAVAAALARANPAANGETLRAMVIRAMQTHGRTVDGIVRLDEVDLRAVLSEHSPQK